MPVGSGGGRKIETIGEFIDIILKCSDCINQNKYLLCRIIGTPYLCEKYLDLDMINALKFKKWIKG